MNRCFFLFSPLIFIASIFGNPVEDGLKQLSLNEKICIKAFFDEAIFKDQAAHVLFFMNKPVCFTGPALKHCDKNYRDMLALRGWQAFKKHENLFPHPNFIFCECLREVDGDYKMLDIYIINKRSLINCLTQHEALFKTTLGRDFNLHEFIGKLENGQPLPFLIHKNEMLLGVLLGYGEESAKAFNEIVTNHKERFAPPSTEIYQKIELRRPKGSKIQPVVFMGNQQSSEVKDLTATYEAELKEISKMYSKKNGSLKMVLEKLCED